MKVKRIISITIAAALAALSAVSVSAAQLTETNQSGNTEVIAHIDGAAPGDVSYIITIPDANDNDDHNKDVTYAVEATEITGLDTAKQAIAVYVKDQNASADDRAFQIANKENSAIEFNYDVYRSTETLNESTRVNNGDFFTKGYYLTSFNEEGQTLNGTLRFHQKQLYGQNIAEIAGDYSGYMVFFSTIDNV